MKISILLPTYNLKDLLYNTLKSYDYFYGDNDNVEVIIVDDCSNIENQFPKVRDDFPRLNIKNHRIEVKCGYNPSLAYNVAARLASNDILVLTSPETIHTKSIYEDFENFQTHDLFVFSVFCVTDQPLKKFLLSDWAFEDKLQAINDGRAEFEQNIGCNGYQYGNNLGVWYLHSKYKPSRLNFLTGMSKELYYEIGGFNEAFMQGTGYDDTDFLFRLEPYIENTVWFDDALAIHIDHDLAAPSQIKQESNYNLFIALQTNPTYVKNDDWGLN